VRNAMNFFKKELESNEADLREELGIGQKGANGELKNMKQMRELSENIRYMVKDKADRHHIRELRDEKTSKLDTQAHLQTINVLHRMMSHMSVLLLESIKAGVKSKESSVTRQ
jgi:hypothetical protein